MNNKLIRGLTVVLVGAIIWFLPVPTGVKPEAWHLLAIFTATILGFILQPLPIGAVAFISLTFTAFSGTLKIGQVLSGFSQTVVWLIVAAFLFSRGFVKTGVGRRIAFQLIKYFGDNSLKLAYVLIISDLCIAPATPSNTARAGGIMFPVVRSLASSFGSEPGPSAKKIGSFLIQAVYHGDTITSAVFLTAMAGNPLMVALAAKAAGVTISWGTWFMAASLPAACSLLVIPYFIYKCEAPEITKTPEARQLAERELEKMGLMRREEKWLLAIFGVALALWATSQFTGLDATLVAMLAVSAMLVARVLEWSDVTEEKSGWDTMIWMGSLICLAGFLNTLGLIPWFAKMVSGSIVGMPWQYAFILVVVVYTYAHYAFASLTAHIAAMFSAFLAVAVAVGTPPYLATLALFFASSISQGITHYAAGPAPIYFGAGYVSQGRWWKLGFMVSFINLVIWIGLGSMWWKVLGLW
jgi:DASS family divalent anion:Na+ symporter